MARVISNGVVKRHYDRVTSKRLLKYFTANWTAKARLRKEKLRTYSNLNWKYEIKSLADLNYKPNKKSIWRYNQIIEITVRNWFSVEIRDFVGRNWLVKERDIAVWEESNYELRVAWRRKLV